MNFKFFLHITVITLFLTGCAARTNLDPVGKGQVNVSGSIGGPIVAAFGTHVPVPYAIVGANYGLTERINLTGNLHLLSLFYNIFGADFGMGWFPFKNEGYIPTVCLQPRLLLLASLKSGVDSRFRAYPIVSTSAAWSLGKGTIYSGFDLTALVSSPDYDDDASPFIFSHFLGYRWKLGSTTRLLTEIKWHGANIRSDQLAVEYIQIGSYGAITPLVSIEKRF
ncbi:MAG: hypothetical protein P9X24_10420 [Candidatus Hatepunaea meridiana]|nr:hypothetical protein [Candidatus Hatepunaea meridiana]